MIPMKMYLQTVNSTKAKEKNRLCQLLLQRNAIQLTLPPWLLRYPSFQQHAPQLPKDLPPGNHLLIKEWLPRTCKKETGEEFKTFDLVDVNGGPWYRVSIFTFWCNKVEKGSISEPDMEHNYIKLYKTHKDSSK